jgi:hypothetical protein
MENEYKYLYTIIRKPQEGKTFICLENIKQNSDIIHFIVTMNTIKSNKQFFERAKDQFGEKLIVLNSENKGVSYQTKNILNVWKGIKDNKIEIVIMCGHKVRFTESIHALIDLINSTSGCNKKIIIHIDEAHKYIPSYRDDVNKMNNEEIIERIYCYSATPFKLWNDTKHDIYKKIYIVDVQEQLNITDSTKYFGVTNTELYVVSKLNGNTFEKTIEFSKIIPQYIIDRWEPDLTSKNEWYNKSKTYFSLGKEYEYLAFLKYTIMDMISKDFVNNESFSYNFFPGYIRRVTHYGVMDIIISNLDKALVIIFNGEVCSGFIKEQNNIKELKLNNDNEPSSQIQDIIERYPNRPTFITGHICIGMSVTLINQNIGNFDNAVLSFPQYYNQHDVLYQMCRFLFNFIKWEKKNQLKIKRTRFITENKEDYDICLAYEKQIDIINKDWKGSLRTKDEVKGDIKVNEIKKPKEMKHDKINSFVKINNHIPFKVYNGNDESVWEEVREYWLKFKGIKMSVKSMLTKTTEGFFKSCTTTNPKPYDLHNMKRYLKKIKWNSNFMLVKNNYRYSRLYIGYDDLTDNTEYTIFVRIMELEKNEIVEEHLNSL